jgi:hypothetical protein
MNKSKRFVNMIALAKVTRQIKGKDQICIILQSDEFLQDDVHAEIYAAIRWISVDQTSPIDAIFDDSNQPIDNDDQAPPKDDQKI